MSNERVRKEIKLYATDMIVPSEVTMGSVIGTKDGRIFMCGSQDGNLYELHYQEKEGWFGKKVHLINHSVGGVQSLFPRLSPPSSDGQYMYHPLYLVHPQCCRSNLLRCLGQHPRLLLHAIGQGHDFGLQNCQRKIDRARPNHHWSVQIGTRKSPGSASACNAIFHYRSSRSPPRRIKIRHPTRGCHSQRTSTIPLSFLGIELLPWRGRKWFRLAALYPSHSRPASSNQLYPPRRSVSNGLHSHPCSRPYTATTATSSISYLRGLVARQLLLL
jgi:hypothetical protein